MESTPPSDSHKDLPSEEEFEEWLRAHPENLGYFLELIGKVEKGEYGDMPPEIREITRTVLEKHKASEQIRTVQGEMRELMMELQRVMQTSVTPEAIQGLSERCGAVIDAALDLPEPHRSGIMQELVPLRDGIRAIGGNLE